MHVDHVVTCCDVLAAGTAIASVVEADGATLRGTAAWISFIAFIVRCLLML